MLIGLVADKAKTPREQALWESLAKKFSSCDVQGISIACTGLALWMSTPNQPTLQCAL